MGKKLNRSVIAKKRIDQKKRCERKKAFIRKLMFQSFNDIRNALNPSPIPIPKESFPIDDYEFILANERFNALESRRILFRKFN